jgi:hypothetical protein
MVHEKPPGEFNEDLAGNHTLYSADNHRDNSP